MLYVGVYKFLIFLIAVLLIILVIFTEFVSPVLSVVLFVKGRKGKKNISIDHNKTLVWRPFFAKRNFYFRRSEFVNNKTNKKYRFIEFGRRFNDYISKPGAILSFIGFAHVILSGLIVCFGACFITNGLINGVDKIFLNFSDPWPKKGYAKRRLTHRKYLAVYMNLLKDGGTLRFKTDNVGLFDFSLEEIEAMGLTPEIVTRDLHASEWNEGNIMTEYERNFSEQGVKINMLVLKKPAGFNPDVLPEFTSENKRYDFSEQ